MARNHGMVTRVLSDVPGQSAGDLVDGLTKVEEEVALTPTPSSSFLPQPTSS